MHQTKERAITICKHCVTSATEGLLKVQMTRGEDVDISWGGYIESSKADIYVYTHRNISNAYSTLCKAGKVTGCSQGDY